MNQRTNKVFAIVRAKQQQHHIGKTITTSIFGRMVEGKILAIHPFGTVDLETSSGCYRVSGIYLNTKEQS
jgi:hypothetical protein